MLASRGDDGRTPGGLLGLCWRNVDLDGEKLRIETNSSFPTPGRPTFGSPKSRRSERTIALNADTAAALRKHRDTQQLERDLAGPAYADHDLVFCNELGQPIHPQRLSEWFSKRRKAAGIPTGSLHILRHTAAILAVTADPPVPLHVVSGALAMNLRRCSASTPTYSRTPTRWPPKRSRPFWVTKR
jgi:integrase